MDVPLLFLPLKHKILIGIIVIDHIHIRFCKTEKKKAARGYQTIQPLKSGNASACLPETKN